MAGHWRPSSQRARESQGKRRYSPGEVAKATGLHVETIRLALKSGELKGVRTGRAGHYWHIPAPSLREWIENRKRPTPNG